mmetsp:Transcript_32134/g.44559  ORF Transcript_32134/g.44559 Transcript_32134/m.44559 type:complete len:282 (-) Transcript_32134:258-1103(-)
MKGNPLMTAAVVGGICIGMFFFSCHRKSRRGARWRGAGSQGGFQGAAARVSAYRGSLTDAVRLQLYALYKQGTVGPCTGTRPGRMDVVGRAKWDAWAGIQEVGRVEAQRQYRQLVEATLPKDGTQQAPQQDNGMDVGDSFSGFGGPIFGTLIIEPPEQDAADKAKNALPEDAIISLAKKGDVKEVEALLQQGTEINFVDGDGRSALYWAADSGKLDLVQALLKHGADPQIQDEEGMTALHCAAVCEHEQICRALVADGANPDLEDKNGESARELFHEDWKL